MRLPTPVTGRVSGGDQREEILIGTQVKQVPERETKMAGKGQAVRSRPS